MGGDNKVNVRSIKVGDKTGQMWIIQEGLQPGERVVTEGVQKVRDGAMVKPTLVAAPAEGK